MGKIKSALKNIICFILYYGGLVQLVMRFVLPKKKNIPVIILIYHRITRDAEKDINSNLTINHPKRNFLKEMRFIKQWLNVVTLKEAIDVIKRKKTSDKPVVAVTFDDGFRDNYTLAHPILTAMDIPATVYLTTGCVGTNDKPLKIVEVQCGKYIEEDDIERLDDDFQRIGAKRKEI